MSAAGFPTRRDPRVPPLPLSLPLSSLPPPEPPPAPPARRAIHGREGRLRVGEELCEAPCGGSARAHTPRTLSHPYTSLPGVRPGQVTCVCVVLSAWTHRYTARSPPPHPRHLTAHNASEGSLFFFFSLALPVVLAWGKNLPSCRPCGAGGHTELLKFLSFNLLYWCEIKALLSHVVQLGRREN